MGNKINIWTIDSHLNAFLGKAQMGLTYPKFCLMVREVVLERLLANAENDNALIKGIIEEVKGRGRFYPIDTSTTIKLVAGADAGSYVFPLSSRYLAVISSVVHRLPESRCYFLKPVAVEHPHVISDEKFDEILCLNREAFLFRAATQYIKSNSDEVELLLVDGPLAFSNWFSCIGREEDRQFLASCVNDLLDYCERAGICVAGVVKRATARCYLKHLGLEQKTVLSDSSVLIHVLRKGYRTELFSPASSFMDRINFLIDSFYARFSADDIISPVRIDMPKFSEGSVDDVASYCYIKAHFLGIPLPITKADEDARLAKRFMREIYAEALSKAKRRFGSISWLLLSDGKWLIE